jgi:hypothetical protein
VTGSLSQHARDATMPSATIVCSRRKAKPCGLFLACRNNLRHGSRGSSITAKATRGAPVNAILPIKAVHCFCGAVGADLIEVGNRQNRHAGALCHLTKRLEHAAYLAVFMAVGLAKVRRYRVNNYERHVANLGYLPLQQLYIGLKVEGALPFAARIANSGNNMHAIKGSPGRH